MHSEPISQLISKTLVGGPAPPTCCGSFDQRDADWHKEMISRCRQKICLFSEREAGNIPAGSDWQTTAGIAAICQGFMNDDEDELAADEAVSCYNCR